MKRIARILAVAVAVVVTSLAALAWYVTGLPWRNTCASPAPAPPTEPTNAAVATSQPLATRAAADILRRGGTAADAAVGAALMLAVAEPGNSGLGGGGFALVHDPRDGQTTALDFREQAPMALDVAALTAAVQANPNALRNGALAVAVPSEWDGLVELHRRFGRLPMADLAAPAIAAARDGVEVGAEYCARCWVRSSVLRDSDDARQTFMTSLGVCPLPGWTVRQPELAATLAALTQGPAPRSFDDVVGRKMVALLRAGGSAITEADLTRERVRQRPTVTGRYEGRTITSMGPPSSGGAIVIGLLQSYERMRDRLPDANRHHLWTEAARLAFFDRARFFGDPDFVSVDAARLTSPAYADAQAARVSATEPLVLPDAVPPAAEGDHTTHVSIVDEEGMAVALTMTINVPFGSGLVVPGTGVLLNNEMDDFFLERPNAFELVGNARNAPAPGKRPLSSMAPTMVFEGDRLMMVLGSPGGSGIPSAVAQVIRGVLEDGNTGDVAVRAGRIHHQWMPASLQVEPLFDRDALPADLQANAKKPMFPVGRVQLVWRAPNGFAGVSDCRDQGEAFQAHLPPRPEPSAP